MPSFKTVDTPTGKKTIVYYSYAEIRLIGNGSTAVGGPYYGCGLPPSLPIAYTNIYRQV